MCITIFPIRLDRLPEVVVKPLFIGIPILDDQCLYALGMPDRKPKADRSAIIHDVQAVRLQAKMLGELLDDVGEMVKAVVKLADGRHRAVSNANACEYCTSAHTALGKRFGIDTGELTRNLQGFSGDPKVESALQFARAVSVRRGWVTDEELGRVREAGYTEGEIVEIIATVAMTTFTNYFNHVAETDVDFPVVEIREVAAV